MDIIDLGLSDYLEAYKLQKKIQNEVSLGARKDSVMITEHYPVITAGRRSDKSNIFESPEVLLGKGIKVVDIDRGGDVTYHGPGQIVAYPIFKLKNEARDIHSFLEYLERVGIDFLGKCGIFAETKKGFRGIWVGQKKIASIGIGVKKWTTCHGIALNIKKDLKAFSFIRPCGIDSVEMTSVETVLGRELDISAARDKLKESFKEISLLAKTVCKDQ